MPKSVAAEDRQASLDDLAFQAICWQAELEPMAFAPAALFADLVDHELVLPADGPFSTPCFHPELSPGSPREASFQALTQQHLGFWTAAVHVNGLLADKQMMWLARRSMAKDSDPGMLDNMVAGGLAAGESLEQCLWRECWEEAGLSPEVRETVLMNAGLKALRRIHIQCIEGQTSPWPYFRRERLFAFSLILPPDFLPSNQDGEVSAYCSVDREALAQLIAQSALTKDAALVASLWLQDEH
ncbi:MAG: NUDIX domain-containing protein [Betaproteobacteria bacterium]|nr:NUDIX domain-containing protein [Betaproteobacteria bacterium]